MTCSSVKNSPQSAGCAKSPLAFGKKYLPHYFTCKTPGFHRDICKLWQKRVMKGLNPAHEGAVHRILAAKGRRLAIAAPRGHAKSTIIGLQNVLHAAVFGYKRYILIVSDTESQASGFLDAIKAEIETNETLAGDFGDLRGKVWKSASIQLSNGVRIDAVGSGQKLRGRKNGPRRPDLIVLDDIENDEDVRSAESREKLAAWFFGAVSKAGDRYTDIVLIGTVLHHDSLLARLLKNPAYQTRLYRAVERFSGDPLWDKWREIYTNLENENRERDAQRHFIRHRDKMLENTGVLWPEKASYYDMMCMLVSEGEQAFYREMQNEPADPGSILFPRQWLRFYGEDVDFAHERFALYGYCDPSLGKSATGDYSAIITIAKCGQTGLMYVLDADIARRHPDQIIADILEKSRRWTRELGRSYVAFGAESNQFQWFLKEQLAKESARAGVYLPLAEVYANSDKTLRIQSLQPDVKNGYLLFCEGHRELLSQMTQFPCGRHDDGPDALQGAVALCKKGGGRQGTVSGLWL